MSLTNRQKHGVSAAIQAGVLVNRLKRHAKGEIEMTPTQVQAAKILLDRALPTLSSVEQTVLDPASSMTEDQIIAQMTEIALKHPHLIRQLNAKLGPAPDVAVQSGKSDATDADKAA